jgi:hypothetical protein
MSFFKTLFGTPAKPRTMLDDVQDVSARLIVKGYRKIASQYGCAPTAKTTDAKIFEIYKHVTTAFHQAAQQRGEHISAPFDNRIVLKFLHVFEMMPGNFEKHLDYEVEKYLAEGLRPDYKEALQLFDANGNDPDVKRLKELQNANRGKIEREAERQNNSTLPDLELANTVLQSGVALATELVAMAENAASIKFKKATYELLLNEVVSYYSNVAIAAVMIKKSIFGKENYKQIETEVFEAISKKLGNMLAQYLSIVDRRNRHIAEMYFVKNHDGLGIAEDQVFAFAEKYDQQKILAELPDDQLSVFYYNMRVARILKVHDGIDAVIVLGVSQLLAKRLFEYQDEIQKILN